MDTSLYELFYSLEDTHWWFQGRKELVLSLLRRYTPLPWPRILDVGCGTGGMLAEFQRLGSSIGIDTAPESGTFCRRRGLPMILASGTELPLADASFDVVSALDVIELLDSVQNEKINMMAIVGDAFAKPILAALDKEPGRWDISSLFYITSSGVM